jgi:hypothetical protein
VRALDATVLVEVRAQGDGLQRLAETLQREGFGRPRI